MYEKNITFLLYQSWTTKHLHCNELKSNALKFSYFIDQFSVSMLGSFVAVLNTFKQMQTYMFDNM